MAWIRLDTNILTDEWIDSLTEAERYAWCVFCLWGGTQAPRWKVKKTSITMLSRILGVGQETLTTMLTSAIKARKVADTDDSWIITNGQKYDHDSTNAERQRRHRSKKNQEDSQSQSNDVTLRNGSNESNGTVHNSTVHNSTITEQGISLSTDEPLTEPKPRIDWVDVLRKWNELSLRFPAIPQVKSLTDSRKGHFRARMNSPDFDYDILLQKIAASSFLRGEGKVGNGHSRPYRATFDSVLAPAMCQRILEGEFDTKYETGVITREQESGRIY